MMVSHPHLLICFITLITCSSQSSQSNVITPSCPVEESICEFWLTLSMMKAMSDQGSTFLDPFNPIVYRNGTFMKLNKKECAEEPLEGPGESFTLHRIYSTSYLLYIVFTLHHIYSTSYLLYIVFTLHRIYST